MHYYIKKETPTAVTQLEFLSFLEDGNAML